MAAARKSLGSKLGYRALGLFFRAFGYGAVALLARAIGFFYRLALRRVAASSEEFYRALFPGSTARERRRLFRAQVRSFTTVFVDRLLVEAGHQDRFELEHDGLDGIVAAARERRPLILWMAHLGNWEIAAHCLRRFDVPISLVMGRYEGERVEAFQRERLAARGVRPLIVDEESDVGAVEVVAALRRGEIVSISGDRLYGERQRSVEVDFLGHRCRAPVGPYVLAGLTGAPLVPAFGLRLGRLRYGFVALGPRAVDFSDRGRRREEIARAAQACFRDLESVARRHPEQWYNFFAYWEGPEATQ